ncbi:MAG: methionine--tRNA ligase [Candidatus Andersenbacteria bacterium]
MPRTPYYVTTAIAYVNANPHIGFALEVLAGDVLARYHRLRGDEVRFLTGTDEHGTKVQRAAEKAGVEVQKFADERAARFRDHVRELGATADVFIRTTDPTHVRVAQEFWTRANAAGDIYKKKYRGLYCIGCEAFLTESEVSPEGTCCIHGTKPELTEEENYFFKLSCYRDWLLKHLDNHPEFVQPVGRYNEIHALVESGLEDVSISRPVSKLSWGIPVPGDESHVMYVWFDALTNYVTGAGFLANDRDFGLYWPADVHIVGQDILRFHAALWPAMLKSAGLELPKQIYSHGFVTNAGKKMSKSVGNVVDPFKIVADYGLDATRYYLLAEIPFADGGDFSETRLAERYNAELANGIGNLVARVLQMTHKFADGKVPGGDVDAALVEQAQAFFKLYDAALSDLRFHDALAALNRLVAEANRFVDREKPWSLGASSPARLQAVLRTLLHIVYDVGVHLAPFLPESGDKILGAFGRTLAEATLEQHRQEPLREGLPVKKLEPLFPRRK